MLINSSYRIAFLSALFCDAHCPPCKTAFRAEAVNRHAKSFARAAIFDLLIACHEAHELEINDLRIDSHDSGQEPGMRCCFSFGIIIRDFSQREHNREFANF